MGTALFALSPALSYAQYSQVNTSGGIYTYVNNYSQLYITTTNATSITDTSATLNGLVNGSTLYSTYNLTTWFEYGTNTNLEYSTVQNNSNSGYADYATNISGLTASTIYYFRAVAQSPQGIVYGITNSFRTNFTNVVINTSDNNSSLAPLTPTIITNPATSIGSKSAEFNSLITNSVDNPSTTWFEWGPTPNLGEITPTVSIGLLSSAKHINTITGLAPGTTYYFRAGLENSSIKIYGTTLSFTTNKGTVQSSNTPDKNTDNTAVTNTSVIQPVAGSATPAGLGASIIGSGFFFPVGILGWLLLIILILVLTLLGKHLYRNFSNKKGEHPQEHA